TRIPPWVSSWLRPALGLRPRRWPMGLEYVQTAHIPQTLVDLPPIRKIKVGVDRPLSNRKPDNLVHRPVSKCRERASEAASSNAERQGHSSARRATARPEGPQLGPAGQVDTDPAEHGQQVVDAREYDRRNVDHAP